VNIAIYGKNFDKSFLPTIRSIFQILAINKAEIILHEDFYYFMYDNFNFKPEISLLFTKEKNISPDTDFMLSIGGDGTFLETISYVRNKNIPVVGINTGRLGFLADIAQNEVETCINALFTGDYKYESRSLLQVNTKNNLLGDINFALNEVTVQKKDTSSMITVHAYLNNQLINSFWADGLIVSTPTGSTAYSLSVGGPIVSPGSENFIITPLAPHNLTVRPIVVSNSNEITLKVHGRSKKYLLALDYRSFDFDSSIEINIKKADFDIKLVKLEGHDFFTTLRNKLMWGVDKRN